MTPEQQPATKQDLADLESRLTAIITTRMDRAVESLVGNTSDLRQEMNHRFDQTDRRLEAVTIHLDRVDTRLAALHLETAGMSKSLTAGEKLNIATTATQSAQQKAIDDLYAQLAEIKRRLDQPRQQ